MGSGDWQECDGIVDDWFARHACVAAIVRPDHYVYGVAATAAELGSELQALQQRLQQGDKNATSTTA
jgi:3-(3-hydroxy-phenyl)propionate hydroxylase